MRLFIMFFHIFYLLYIAALILASLGILVIGLIAGVTYIMNDGATWLFFDNIKQWAAALVIMMAVWFVTLTIMDEI